MKVTGAPQIGGPRAGVSGVVRAPGTSLRALEKRQRSLPLGVRLLGGERARPPFWWREWESVPRSRAKPLPHVILRPSAQWIERGERIRAPQGGTCAAA
ncbi:hypothetical protein NDU88_003318 [Pleurodeles waltl]|uniref:Uncharacterized protein n=1 Tax=Pleurodeles waltl TaxID=8319 RepID=A0AAV7LLA0_PLEWA|nr:hypothetical protein NDU88_003318 [Pleurodeles waltl]